MRTEAPARAEKGRPTAHRHHSRAKQGVAVLTAALLGIGGSVLAAAPAMAAPAASTAEGRFLDGTALGLDLANVLLLQPAAATNTGQPAPATQSTPLDATLLNAARADLGSGIQLLGPNGLLTVGAVNEFAQANANGSSTAASGAVTNAGAIGVGGQGGVPQANASFNLSRLVNTQALANLRVTTGALSATAAQAAGPNGAQTGTYQIADLDLSLTSPVLATTINGLRTTLTGLQPTVDAIPGTLTGLLGPTVQVTGLPNLTTLGNSLTTVTSADGSITANLQTGAITLDVPSALASQGVALNSLPAGTDLTPYITTALTTQLLPALTTAVQNLVTQITTSLNGVGATVNVLGLRVPVDLGVLGPVLNGVLATVLAPVNTVLTGLGGTVVTPLATALTGVVSLRVNNKTTAGGTFTQSALRVGLLGVLQAGTGVELASASVGPNAGPLAAPTLTGITPVEGPVAGGTAVTLTGSTYTADSRVSVDGGAPITPTAVSDDGTSLTFTTPAHAAGPVPVTVTTAIGTSGPQTFTYIPVPAITGLTPAQGPVGGGTTVTVAGSGFLDGSTVSVDGSAPITPDSIAADGTSLTFTTPAHALGDAPVTVTTRGGTSAPQTFTYQPAPVGAPVLTGITPDQGPAGGGTAVTITGTNFTAGSTVSVDGSAGIVPTTIADDGTSLTFDTPAHVAGPVPVTVTNGTGTSAPQTFTYVAPPLAAPVLDTITPDEGPVGGGTAVTITGTGFTAGSTVSVDGSAPITPDALAADGTSLTFTTPAHVEGTIAVTVTNAGGTSSPLDFTYTPAPAAAPVLTDIDPEVGPAGGGTPVTVTGTGFAAGSTVSVDGSAPITPDTIATDGTSLTYTSPAHVAGTVPVTVTNAGGTSAPLDFTYEAAPVTAPVLATIDPDEGPAGGGTAVTVTGTGFLAGSTVSVDGSAPITPTAIASDGTSLTYTAPAHVAGTVPVTVTSTGGTSAPLDFTYQPAPPTAPVLETIDPATGPAGGGTVVTVTGTGFTAGSTVTIGDTTGLVPDSVDPAGTSLTFTTPPNAAGDVTVTVTTAGGTSAPLPFTYTAPPAGAPVLTTIAPTSGPVGGRTVVTLTGSGFLPGSTVSIGDTTGLVPDSIDLTGTTLTFTTPANAAGATTVTVTNLAGTSPPLGFTYLPAPDDAPVLISATPAEGPVGGGTVVTVAGSAFTPGSTVSIGDTVGIVPDSISTDGTELTFTTPPNAAGPVSITVTNGAGTSAGLPFTYLPAPADAPVLTAIDPTSGPVGGGTSVTITGTGFTDGSTVSIGDTTGLEPDAVSDDGTELTFTTPPNVAGPVTVTVTNDAGTSAPLGFTYVAAPAGAPVLTAIDPTSGPVGGGTSVTITGTGFAAGSTVSIGVSAGIVPDDISDDGTELTFTTPPNQAGPVSVTVTNDAGTSAPLGFTYLAAPVTAPVLATLTPDSGPVGGGTPVTITGTGFTPDATVTVGGTAGIVPDDVSDDGTELTFTTPPNAAGDVQVTVTTDGGTSAPLTFTYEAAPVGAPVLTGLAPASGPAGGGTVVTVTGTGLAPGSTVTIGGVAGIVPDAISPLGTSLTFTTPPGAAGDAPVTITNLFGTSAPLTFTYVAPPAGSPVLTDIEPAVGPVAGGTTVTLTGTGFTPASTITIGDTTGIVGTLSPDGTQLTFTTPAGTAGGVPVTVTNGTGTSAPLTFTYQAAPVAAPTLTSLTPDEGPAGGGTPVTVVGTGFTGDSTVTVGTTTGIVPDSVSPDGTSLVFTTPAGAAGTTDVSVTNPAGTSGTLPFTYQVAPAGAPVLATLSPTSGPAGGGTRVTITGTGFTAGSTVSVDGSAPITPVSLGTGGTSLTFDTPPHAAGLVQVTATNGTGTSAPLPFTYLAPASTAPLLLSLTPASGPVGGGTVVTISGSGFTPGGTTVSIDGGAPRTPSFVSIDGTSLTFTTPADTAGPVPVTVTTAGGTSAPLTFTYVAAPAGAPVLASLTPSSGPVGGGTTVTITGTGFTAGSTVSVDGSAPIAPITVSADGTSLTFATPAHAAGLVGVTVTNDTGTSAPLTFSYQAAAALAPQLTSLTPPSGPIAGGTVVTVTGTRFTPGSTVSVGGSAPITPDSISADGTTLTFTTPAGTAGSTTVTVTNGAGTSAPLPFVYVDPDTDPSVAPVITSPVQGQVVDTANPVFTGTGTPGYTVTVQIPGRVLCTTVVAGDGTWACAPLGGLPEGEFTATATQTGPDGVTSAASESVDFTVDLPAAGQPGGGTPGAGGTPGGGAGGVGGSGSGGYYSGTAGSGPLAFTGSDTAPVLLAALLLMVAGGFLTLRRRSRRS
ncbi:IPT/TIG domain-containing protein [Frigoribacterium sp. ACAM 257]|uniref:IPT/TIG domain-containing protein n=1 Tax=Frigoribacterium sp. ACAM 257 TaxID=2508998 RepID=UPI00174C726D|nr:IPT/TIG domain-containing protein [Frigoribacterium sp. ACAM 257]